jgi:hypothetical protein
MVRRKHCMLLVCLALLMSTVFLGSAWAAQSEDSAEKIVNKPQVSAQGAVGNLKPKVIAKVKPATMSPPCAYTFARPQITKVKPGYMLSYPAGERLADRGLIAPALSKWDISGGVLFARLRGSIAWPRFPSWGGFSNVTNETDFTDGLELPGHLAVPTWSVKYQFRPNWAVRYSGLAFEANGGGQPSGSISFGPWQQFFGFGQNIQSKYQHGYHRVGLLYDAVKNDRSSVRVFADWVHTDDKIAVISSISVGQNSVFSKGTDAAMAGIEFQRYLKTTSNGGTLSCDCKAGAMFLDDVEGWDAQAGAQYTIPLNNGRSGYVKAGYRLVAMKKTQNDFLLKNALEGGYMELGFIF